MKFTQKTVILETGKKIKAWIPEPEMEKVKKGNYPKIYIEYDYSELLGEFYAATTPEEKQCYAELKDAKTWITSQIQ